VAARLNLCVRPSLRTCLSVPDWITWMAARLNLSSMAARWPRMARFSDSCASAVRTASATVSLSHSKKLVSSSRPAHARAPWLSLRGHMQWCHAYSHVAVQRKHWGGGGGEKKPDLQWVSTRRGWRRCKSNSERPRHARGRLTNVIVADAQLQLLLRDQAEREEQRPQRAIRRQLCLEQRQPVILLHPKLHRAGSGWNTVCDVVAVGVEKLQEAHIGQLGTHRKSLVWTSV
jgi:hypothetical protein